MTDENNLTDNLEELSVDKLKKIAFVSTDQYLELKKELAELAVHINRIHDMIKSKKGGNK